MSYLLLPMALTVSLLVFSAFDDYYTKRAVGVKGYALFWVINLIPGKAGFKTKLCKFKIVVCVLVWLSWLVILSTPSAFFGALSLTVLALLACAMLGSLLHNIGQSKK